MKKVSLLMVMVLGFASLGICGNSNDLLSKGINFHQQALKGDRVALDNAIDTFNQMLNKDAADYTAMAWLGSCFTLKGKFAQNLEDKGMLVQKGLQKLDMAVQMDGENLNVRLVRGLTYLNLPAFFNKLDISISDFAFIINYMNSKNITIGKESLKQVYEGLEKALKVKLESLTK